MKPNEPNSDQGTPGAPASAPAGEGAGGSGSLSEQELQTLLNAPDPPPPGSAPPADEFKDIPWDKVAAATKAGKLPEDLKRAVELPFLQEFTRKNQAFSKEKEALMAGLIDKLSRAGVAPTEPEKDELREKLKEGGLPLDLFDQYLERKMRPLQNDVSSQRMEQLAIAAEPMVEKRRPEIVQYIRENPAVARLMLANGGMDGHEVIANIARLMDYQDIKAKLASYEENLPKLKLEIAKEVIAGLKRTGTILPSSTSRAGTGPTGESRQEFNSFKEAAADAARKLNLPM